jgi:excisionase family DNA binding protein
MVLRRSTVAWKNVQTEVVAEADMEIMTVQEAATYLRTSTYTLKARARAGTVPAVKLGREWRFNKTDLDEWLTTGGAEYEALVDQAMAALTNERMAAGGPSSPLAEVHERLGL